MVLRGLPAFSFLLLAACAPGGGDPATEQPSPAAAQPVSTATAEAAADLPLGTVPGVISLPPDARVAVTSPFAGAAVRVFVIEGQEVRRGQPLATVRAAEPVKIRGELARAEADLRLAQARAARIGQLVDEGILARARVDEVEAELAQARASLAENRRLASLAPTGPDGTLTLTAPITGRVAHVAVEAGGPVDGMSAPFVIEATGPFLVDLQLPERIARDIRPGMAVEVTLPQAQGAPLVVAGAIRSVAPSIDPQTRSVLARASLGAAPGVVAGRNVLVAILGASKVPGVAVPSAAVTRIGGTPHVFVRSGEGFAPRKIVLAGEGGGRSVIAEGLRQGEVVATSSLPELKAAAAE